MNHLAAFLGGVAVGGSYALIAVGVALVFSTTRVLSFAHAGFAMWASYLYAGLAGEKGWPVAAAALVAVASAAVLGLLVERLVMRRLEQVNTVTRMIASLGVLSLLQGVILQTFGFFPKAAPPLFTGGAVGVGTVTVTYQQLTILVAAVALALALTAFLRLTRTGLAVRSMAAEPTVSRLLGVRRVGIARLNWTLGAAMAGVAGVLVAPVTVVSVGTFPILLTKAMVATLLGGIGGLAGAFLGGLAVGGVEALGSSISGTNGMRELAVLGLLAAVLVMRKHWPTDVLHRLTAAEGRGSNWYAPMRATVVCFAVLLVAEALSGGLWAYIGGLTLISILIVLSVVVVTGWSGQLSLMQGTFAGSGAFGLIWLTNRFDLPFALAVPAAVAAGAGLGALVALAGWRLSGLQLGITTLAIAAVASEFLFQTRGVSWSIERPGFLQGDTAMFLTMAGTTALVVVGLASFRRSPWGRAMLAVRTSPETAAHFGVEPRRVRVLAFSLGGGVAALAGVFQVELVSAVTPSDFGPIVSLTAVILFVIGGRDSLAGPLVAALIFTAGPQAVKFSQTSATAIPDIVSGLLVIVLVSVRPAGLADFLRPRRATSREPAPTSVAVPSAESGRRLPRRLTGAGVVA